MPGFDWVTVPQANGTVLLHAMTPVGWAKLILTPDQAAALAFGLDDAAGKAQKIGRRALARGRVAA